MSRRQIIAMTEDEVARYIASQLTIIVVSNGPGGFPHPMPMHFCVEDDGCIAMTTYRKSQKVLNLQRDPRATLLIESGVRYEELRSVVIHAQTEIIDDRDATLACMLACRKHSDAARGDGAASVDDASFRAGAEKRATKRLVLKFHAQQTMSWDHAKLGGVY